MGDDMLLLDSKVCHIPPLEIITGFFFLYYKLNISVSLQSLLPIIPIQIGRTDTDK